MKLSTRIITAILLIAGSSGAVYAFNKHGGWHMSPDEKVEFVTDRVTRKLDLDSQQSQYFGEFAETVAGLMLAARESRQQQFDEVAALLNEPSFDQAKALQLVQQKTQLVNDKAPQVIASLSLFLDSLDAGQKQKLQEFVRHHREHRGHRGHGHSHGHGDLMPEK